MENKMQIIQGDSYQLNVTISGEYTKLINEVYFTCPSLRLCKKLVFKDNKYSLFLSPEETSKLPSFIGFYDLTINFKDGSVITGAYHSSIEVLKKGMVVCVNE